MAAGGGGEEGRGRKLAQGRWPSRAARLQREVERGCDGWPELLAYLLGPSPGIQGTGGREGC